MTKLLCQHLHEAVNGMVNVAQIIEMTGPLTRYFSIWCDVMEAARIYTWKLLKLYQLSLLIGRHLLALLIQVRFVIINLFYISPLLLRIFTFNLEFEFHRAIIRQVDRRIGHSYERHFDNC